MTKEDFKNIPKISIADFYKNEIRTFVAEWPTNLLFLITVLSFVCLWRLDDELNELSKAVLGGVSSSLLFFIFIELLPKIDLKRRHLEKFSITLLEVIGQFHNTYEKLKIEFSSIEVDFIQKDRFFKLLQTQAIEYMPKTTNLQVVIRIEDTKPITPVYGNLGATLENDIRRFKQRLIRLEKIAALCDLDKYSLESFILIDDLDNKSDLKGFINNLKHFKNSAALYGTDLDLVLNDLLKVSANLAKSFKIEGLPKQFVAQDPEKIYFP